MYLTSTIIGAEILTKTIAANTTVNQLMLSASSSGIASAVIIAVKVEPVT